LQAFPGLEGASVAEARPTQGERAAILEQLERMLAHHAFKNSKRCTSLLRHLVEQALDNPTLSIKERTLGMDVFGRSASYDTALDPVVRMTASEIRKRIAQYYHEHAADREAELRIELPAGSYMPEFRFNPLPLVQAVQDEAAVDLHPAENRSSPAEPPPGSSRRYPRLLYGIAGAIATLILAGVAITHWIAPSNAISFWSPLLTAPNRVLICVGSAHPPSGPLVAPFEGNAVLTTAPTTTAETPRPQVPMNDVNAITKIVGVLGSNKKAYEIRSADSSRLGDLRAGPVILIGVFDNAWAKQLSSSLRFHFEEDLKSRVLRIRDSNDPARLDWAIDKDQGEKDFKKDYAVVSRYFDGTTGTPILIVAGLGSFGTNAAAEFVSNPGYLDSLGKSASNCKRNIQIVLQVQVMDETSGPPQVLAINCW
jgi:hypothetical protein